MTDPIALLRQSLADAAYAAIYQQAKQDEAEESRGSYTGYYRGFDADTGLASVELPDGSRVRGTVNTARAIAIGAKVNFTRAEGQLYGVVEAMN